MKQDIIINSATAMIKAIRTYGFIPLFKCGIEGWSIEEMTEPEYWFTSSDQLGPWDWKIEAVREGDIAYGKFLGGAAGFATIEYYRHLMNYRRSLPKYRVALGEDFQSTKQKEVQMKALAPTAFKLIKERGAVESKEIRMALGVKKNVSDTVISFLEMGTWTVVADFIRLYRGKNLEYNGWQRSIITMPDDLFEEPTKVDCTPEESRRLLIDHVKSFYPDEVKKIEKII